MATSRQKAHARWKLALTIFLVACLGISALWCYRRHQLTVEYAGYKQQGLQLARAGDNQHALELLGKYIRRYPSDSEDADCLRRCAAERSAAPGGAPDRNGADPAAFALV